MKLGLFTADQVCSLCGISARQLGYWNRTGFFKPRLAEGERRPFNRIYSFRDVVGLRTIGRLRNQYHVPLADLRRISDELKKTPDADWSRLVFLKIQSLKKSVASPQSQYTVAFIFGIRKVAK
jgi:DNA-binding transcriptional MerR regulator